MKKFYVLIFLCLSQSAFSGENASNLSEHTLLSAKTLYSSEENAIKDNRLQIEHQCFEELNGMSLIYLNNTTTVLPPPKNNHDFGNSYDVETEGLCIIKD